MYKVCRGKRFELHYTSNSFADCFRVAMELFRKLEEQGLGEGVVIEQDRCVRLLTMAPDGGGCTWYPSKATLSGGGGSWFNGYWFPCKESAQAFADYLGESRCPPGGLFEYKCSVSPAGNQWLVTQLWVRDI